jgi:hypothetical protein
VLPRRANFWLKWMLPIVLLVVVAMSVVPLRGVAKTTLVGFVHIGIQTNGSLPLVPDRSADEPGGDGCAAWRMQLRLDPALKAPGPAWMIFEGAKPGGGYELHWQPSHLALQLFRASDQMLLGSACLDRFPAQVVFARRGYQLEVSADERLVFACLDPLPAPPAANCGFSTSGPLLDSTFSIHDDRALLDPRTLAALAIDRKEELRPLLEATGRPDVTVLNVRYALSLDPEKAAADMVSALERAGAAVRAIGAQHPDRIRLQHWLAWGEVHLALARQDLDAPQRTSAAIQQLAELGEQQPSGENLGLLLEVLERITRVCARPPYRAPAEVMRWRRSWFDILAYTAAKADAACAPLKTDSGAIPAVGDDWRWQLRLLAHGAECLRGPPDAPSGADDTMSLPRQPWPRPTPAEAPDWVVCRWRAFAGGDPGGPAFSGDIPIAPDERNPIRPALVRLIQLAGFEPVAAVQTKAHILDALDAQTPANAPPEARRANEQRALEAARTAPAREAALDLALLALHGVGDLAQALAELDPDPKHQTPNTDGVVPWARRDPLAYALYRLLQHRQAEAAAATPTANPLGKPEDLPDGLAPFTRLLSGRLEATHEAWLTDPQVLPPAQALAAALAMQEVIGLPGVRPDWRLLDQLPCFTLPLRLMKRGAPAGAPPPAVGPARPTVP